MNACTGDEARSTAEAVARRSYGKLVAFVAARSRDVAAAEDALSEAFASALQSWPQNGCPANPEAWLLTVARRKLIDMTRRQHGNELVDADLDRIAQGAASAGRGDSGPAPGAYVCLCASCDRGRDPCSVDFADHFGT